MNAATPKRPDRTKIVMWLVMFGLIGGWWYLVLDRRMALDHGCEDWVSVMGTMVSHRAEENPSFEGGYKGMVGYLFEIDGVPYSGDRVRLNDQFVYPDMVSAMSYLETSYPVREPVRIYYDPADPSQNCLEPFATNRPVGWLILGGSIFTIAVFTCCGLVLLGDRGAGFDPPPSQ